MLGGKPDDSIVDGSFSSGSTSTIYSFIGCYVLHLKSPPPLRHDFILLQICCLRFPNLVL